MNTTVFVLILFAHVGPMGDGNCMHHFVTY